MKLDFLIIAWLIHVNLGLCDSSENVKTDMARMFDTMSEKVLSSLTRSLSKRMDRQKREVGIHQSTIEDSGVYRVVNVRPVASLCQPAIRTLFLDVLNTTYFVCVTASTTDSPATVEVGYYKDHSWTPIHRWIVNNAVDAAAFYFKSHIYVLVADSDKNLGLELVKINLKTNVLVRDHDVTGNYATSVALWKMKTDGQLNLAVANSNGYKDAADLSTEVYIYKWKGTYFDRYASVGAYDVKDIEPFHIHGVPYIAVANFRRGRNRPRVDSEIFRFDQDKRRWISLQKIGTYGAMDWEFFSLGAGLGQEFFLAVANKGNEGQSNAKSMIYKFVDDKFVPFQCLQTERATSFASFSRDGMFLLAVANENDAVHLYEYDGWRFVRSGVQSTRGAMAEGAVHLKFHRVTLDLKEVLILSVGNPRHPLYKSVFEVSFDHENLLGEWRSKSTDWCLNILSKLESTDLDKTLDFSDVIFTDQPFVSINGDVVFEQGFEADSLKTPTLKDLSTEEVFDNNLLNKLESLQMRLNVIKRKLEGFSDVLKNALRVEGTQSIQSNLQFQDAFFNCRNRSCRFENIHTEILNGERIADWANRVVFTDNKQVINGTLMSRDINASSIRVLGLVDGVKSEDLVTKSGTHSIVGHKTFSNSIITKDIHVAGKVDGVTISPSTVLLSTGHQMVRGNATFEDLKTTWLRAGYVNKKNLTEFYHDIVLTSKPCIISGEKTFNDVAVNELTLRPGSTINGVDIVNLWKNVLWIDGIQEIQAEMTFSDAMFQKNVDVSLGINGIQIPSSRIVDITEPGNIEASQVFHNSTNIGSLEVLESLNGISVLLAPDGSKQLDVILNNGNQIITGTKTFQTIHLDADSDVKGLVDGVDLSELEGAVLRKNTSVVTNGTWVFKSLIVKGPLTVEGMLSNVDLKDVYQKALKLDESAIPEIVFKNNIYVEDLQCRSINDIDVKNELVLINENQTITGSKTFNQMILEDDSLVLGLMNNMNFSFLNEVLLVIGNQHIKSKNFSRDVSIRDLTVEGTINGIHVAEIVSLKGGKISGSRVLDNITFSEIKARNVEVTGQVNDIDVKEMIDDTMTYYGNQEVTGLKDVKGTVHIMNDTNLQTNDFNGIDLSALWIDAVLTDVQQEISGAVIFEDNVIFNSFSFTGTLDGVSGWEMRNWMLRHEPQIVEGSTTFKNGFTARDLNVHAVNGLDLNHLESDIVKVNEASEILGSVLFEKSIISTGNIILTGKIQGVDLSEEAVSKDNLVVTGEKTFSEDVVIKGDLHIDGLINGIDIQDICNKTFLRNKNIDLSRLVIKGDVILKEGAIDGNLTEVDLSLFKDIALRNGSKIQFSGLKTFTNITLDGPVKLNGTFGKIDLNKLEENYMSTTRNQEISAKLEFDDLAFEGDLVATNLNTANKEINGINLPNLQNRILRTSHTQNVTAVYYIDEVHFANDVFVVGKVNGLQLPGGVMRHNQINYIQSPKIFQQAVVIHGDLDLDSGKTVQGVDLSDWLKKAVFNRGRFQIHGYKIFNELHLTDVKVEGKLDGLRISEESLLMVYGNQVITRRKIVAGNVDIEGSLVVNGLINMINLSDLEHKSVQRDRKYTISGLKYFTQPLTATSLKAPAVSGIDIVELEEKLNTTLDLRRLENQLEEIEGVVSHMQLAFNSQAVVFQYYELFDEFAIPSAYDWLYVSGPDCGELLLLLDGSSSNAPCSSIRIFGFEKVSNSFIPARQELTTSYAVSVKSLSLNSTLLFVANKNPNLPCSSNLDLGKTTVDIHTWSIDSFKKLSSLQINQPVDMVVFKDGSEACLVVLAGDSKVYCSLNNVNWTINEVLFTRGGQKISLLQSHMIMLAIAAEDTSYMRQDYVDGQRHVAVYLWNSETKKFSAPRQVISSTFTQSIALMKHIDRNSEEVFLAIAEGSMPMIHNKPKILIYRYEDSSNEFQKYQEIDDYGTIEWLSLKTGELLFFALDSLRGEVKVYQYKGISGFVKMDTIKSTGTTRVHAFIRPDPEDWLNHYIALAGPHATMAQPTQGDYYAKILKSKVKGNRLLY